MKTFIFSAVSMTLGAVAGGFAGYILTRKKYEKLADKEVESVKKSLQEYYENKMKEGKNNVKVPADATVKKNNINRPKMDVPVKDTSSINYDNFENENDKKSYNEYIKKYRSSEEIKMEEKFGNGKSFRPYIISPEEFSDSEYDVETLHYYRDGVVADDDNNIIKDVKSTIGDEALNTFGVYEDDVVYVRNDEIKIDFEILLEQDEYTNIAPNKGKLVNQFPTED